MPRKPKTGRRFNTNPEPATREEIRERFSSAVKMWCICDHARFLAELLPAERRTFAEVFPAEFLDLWRFVAHESDEWPASIHHGEPFRRPLEFYDGREISGFEPPVITGKPGPQYPAERLALILARGRFWLQQNWPMADAEKVWLETEGHPEPRHDDGGPRVVQMPTNGETHGHRESEN